MLGSILPTYVCCGEETGAPSVTTIPYPEEAHAMQCSVASRQREYYSARSCARSALVKLGDTPQVIPTGKHREPLLPPDVADSITHCLGYRAAAVANLSHVASLGIDAEPNAPLPAGVLERIFVSCRKSSYA
ncbi:MAG: 4'-phosphopantetheinyl transferase family protein [Propionibacteriaceae bacterium]